MNLTALTVGSRLVILEKFSLSGFLDTIHQHKVNLHKVSRSMTNL